MQRLLSLPEASPGPYSRLMRFLRLPCSRWDFEGIESDKAEAVVSGLREIIADPSEVSPGAEMTNDGVMFFFDFFFMIINPMCH